ncbi:MAG: polyprenyl diphosphate synthase [Halovenus sp.]|uniref:polyprenyl diphosphate synthase n=1 Tax=Halovenus amylolytica TaxID=2500550 RepID=UPI000FE2E20A
MIDRLRKPIEQLYAQVLETEIGDPPSHIAVIMDGNRRYADTQGVEKTEGHRAGADTTEAILRWSEQLGIEEITLYAFSTENFNRPEDEREALFDLITGKLREFADAEDVHENEVRIRAIGETHRLPERVQEAIQYADERTGSYDRLYLNIALAYGGRAELLGATTEIAGQVDRGELEPAEVTVDTVEQALLDGPTQSVDLIIRTGGNERTSNFLPWQANGNEAAVYFSAPYWPEFRKIDFLRGLRTYGHRDESWHQTRLRRGRAAMTVLAQKTKRGVAGIGRTLRGDPPASDEESAETPPKSVD